MLTAKKRGSRIGRKPIHLPESVKMIEQSGSITVEGPKGQLTWRLPAGVTVRLEKENNTETAYVEPPPPSRNNQGFQGLAGAKIANMVKGVVNGFQRSLEINGVGYKVEFQAKDNELVFAAGYSHLVKLKLLKGITVQIDKTQTKIVVIGIDIEAVGAMAAMIRMVRKPEPYKGKGIKYSDEVIRRKVGKAGK